MTNPNLTSITIILDKSGSMADCIDDTIGGFNQFIESQQKLPGECEVSLVQFSNQSETCYKSVPVKNVEQLTKEKYVPMGMTAMHDAIGKTIYEKGVELARKPENERPSKVTFVIITDGQENASTTYNSLKIKEMITHQKEVYNWDFVFLGANIDTNAVSNSLNIDLNKSLSYSSTKRGGLKRAFASVDNYIGSARMTKSANLNDVTFSNADRELNS